MSAAGVVDCAARLAALIPASQLEALARSIEASEGQDWAAARGQILEVAPLPYPRSLVSELLAVWHATEPRVLPVAVAMALRAALAAMQRARAEQRIELVWTGPSAGGAAMRRTDQALLEVSARARSTLLVVSFAVYRIPTITAALVHAANRGVRLRICLEAPEPSSDRIAFDTIAALGPDVVRQAALYIWPRDRRPVDENGHAGSLHAKCAVADRELLFVSSANLTGYALALNMELGVLIEGGNLPAVVAAQFEQLIASGLLTPVDSSRG